MIKILKNRDYRITRQRQIILEEICKVSTHPTALNVLQMVKKRVPGIGMATVYRSLDFLEENGLILKLKSKNRVARYDGKVDAHCHLICEKCVSVIDIFDLKSISIESEELKRSGFKPSLGFLEIPGICKKCLK